MKYLFDNNSISDLYDNKSKNNPFIIEHLKQLSNKDSVVISVVTFYELEYAYCNAPNEKKIIIRNDINNLKDNFEIIQLSIVKCRNVRNIKKEI